MELGFACVVNLAKRVVEKYKLSPPIDVEALVEKYATLAYEDIPFDGADGISLYLKVPGKRPHVIVSKNNPQARQRFTLAHELGHVLIPWHTGNIIDSLDVRSAQDHDDFYQVEQEANLFAAELLMPEKWIVDLVEHEDDLALCHRSICKECSTSAISAAIRLIKFLPKNIVSAVERDGVVEFSGRSSGTLASQLPYRQPIKDDSFDYADEYYRVELGKQVFHWWVLPSRIKISKSNSRSWKKILDGIVADFDLDPVVAKDLKASINGVIAYANGSSKRDATEYCVDSVVSAALQRFRSKSELVEYVNHPEFELFILKKAEELVGK